MLKLGLTGSIATGKSTVLKAFADLGIPTFSSDEAVHELYRGAAVAPVEAAFPGVAVGGIIDRDKLSRQLIGHPGRLQQLEAIVHPLVRARIRDFLSDAAVVGEPMAVVDIPLLFENGVDWGLDAIIVTVVDAAEQRRRALARPGMTVEKLEAILARQLPQAEKVKRATYIIDTSDTIEATREAVARLVQRLRQEAQAR
ncbi:MULTISPECIES: dephospho-CoA kinase [unclassified Devosia]|uniref:dephospho-CoA kinase n=1 Tax=unclassified Devosia TaxID=196773 RepID=UPI00086C8E32|nr:MULTISPECIES: dephospho-CoA kinase [unclassified Devosia]MBN9362272.1 dephospho-CoA kinase [Devosia sp.]ODS91372.1 MAG: dephospho-CoA kinase [Devosia sp. SCN 66-27]OJX24480.1 MAG: dephospho-CoA kinase [Devosia sp. 66-14]